MLEQSQGKLVLWLYTTISTEAGLAGLASHKKEQVYIMNRGRDPYQRSLVVEITCDPNQSLGKTCE